MKEIAFNNTTEIALIDDADWDLIKDYKWTTFRSFSSHKEKRYALAATTINSRKTTVMMHRLILLCPKGYVVDHINHNGLDNRRKNLRLLTYSQNALAKNCRPFDEKDARFTKSKPFKSIIP